MSNENQMLMDVAVFGEQVRQFMESPVGRYLLQKADEEKDLAILELVNVDAQDYKAVQSAQNQFQRAEDFQAWLTEAVTKGLQALQILDSRE